MSRTVLRRLWSAATVALVASLLVVLPSQAAHADESMLARLPVRTVRLSLDILFFLFWSGVIHLARCLPDAVIWVVAFD